MKIWLFHLYFNNSITSFKKNHLGGTLWSTIQKCIRIWSFILNRKHRPSVHWPGCIKFPKLSDTQETPHSPFKQTHLFLASCCTILLIVAFRLEFYLLWSCSCLLQFRNTTWTKKHKLNCICCFSKAWKEQDKKIKNLPMTIKLWTASSWEFFLLLNQNRVLPQYLMCSSHFSNQHLKMI